MLGENEGRPKGGPFGKRSFPRRCYSSAIISFNGFPGHCIMFCRVCNTIACDVLLDTWVKKKGDYGINSKNLTMTKVKNTAPWAAPRQSQGFWIPRRGFGIPITGFQIFLLELGFWIPTAIFWVPKSRILDSTSKNFQDSGFNRQKFSGFRNSDSLTWVDSSTRKLLLRCCVDTFHFVYEIFIV